MKNKINYLLYTVVLLYSAFTFCQEKSVYDLNFNPENYKMQELTLEGKSFKVRAYENIVYVANPVDTSYQKLNIYIPEEYFSGKSINGYTGANAPIFFPNEIGGYMPAHPATASPSKKGKFPSHMGDIPAGTKPPEGEKLPLGGLGSMPMGMMGPNRPSAVLTALSKGYVVASAGARGRTTKTGKAPAVIVDLKAAIRYLKFNDSRMAGDANKIVSNGTSAGGAISALLGATGNNTDYDPYLKALGAANATDDIFAVSAYCPITNLDNADMVYEWQFNGINSTAQRKFPGMNTTAGNTALTADQLKISSELKKSFTAYVNNLQLTGSRGEKLTLDEKGNGAFKDYVKKCVIASAQKELDKGTDLAKHAWLTIKGKKVTDIDFESYIKYMTRMKTPPAFDALDLSAGENQLFGTDKIDKQHFTAFSANNAQVKSTADAAIIKIMNPMKYIGLPNTNTSKYWRIRHGSKDSDTGLAVSVILATYLENKGFNVDFALPWDKPHSGDYDLEELFAWADTICKK
ncbi:alpha/beta hydrolase [Flavobacterium rivuli WB 3.3-2 = DSM 21788]|uniref:Alpha/beta hydrolase n=1 Tax=Flavobacterium rivuli WB 3.3-2 = DSM 21788 TaxID=1121895 RepID=A0A0A2MDE7_9FLAO|nr:subtype B tannase [Flavobacterium rivuli]KGO86325.1 alpha/beta hydrolase [Flavobacterium rivuli WB 3.3-2 = DSM 21788]